MKRTGTVASINASRGMVAIATTDDAYTIIELLSDFELNIGDEMSWSNGYGLGHEVYRNINTQCSEEVYVQNHSVSQNCLRDQLLF